MTSTDRLVENAAAHARTFGKGELPAPPSLSLAVLTCMDARINVYAVLGLAEGEAHVLRNAGGVVTDDAIRSLAISQRELGTRELMLIHHAGCGMRSITDERFKAAIEADTGIRPPWSPEAFADAAGDVRQSINRVKASPFLTHKDGVRGFVYDERTGRLDEVSASGDT